MLAFLATGPLGVMFYNMLPACGPIHIFWPRFSLASAFYGGRHATDGRAYPGQGSPATLSHPCT
jgi:hypothetical protein